MKNKRVLYHLRTQGTGSEGVHIRGLVTAFREAGFEVDFVWPLGQGDPTTRAGDNPYDRKRRKSLVEVIVPLIPGPVFSFMEFCYNLWAYRHIKAAVKSRRYDFIYERHFFFSFASGIVARREGIPLVVEVNELAGIERVRGNHLTWLARRCERSLFSNATIVSVVSKFLKDTITRNYPGIDTSRVKVIPNGVRRDTFGREYRGRSLRKEYGIEDKVVFGFIGFFLHVSSWHALEWFLSAFIDAVRERPEAVLLLVGDGPGRQRLEEIAREGDFTGRMFITGIIPNEKIGDYIDAMDIGTIPHTNEYRSPIKMFEYMGLGKPILAPVQEPVTSVLGEVQGDYLFDAKSAESLKEAVDRVFESRSSWPEKGKILRDMCRSSYTYERHGETILHFLERPEQQT